jgi:autotransporter-associated beta strand protein
MKPKSHSHLFSIPFASAIAAMLATQANAQTQNYFGTSGTLNGSVWSTNPAGPYTSALVTTGGAIINFGNAATFTGASITVAGINATADAAVGTTGGTISNLSNGVIPISVASGVTLNFGSQSFTSSATAGYIKNGDGTLAMAGNTYGGGFTLNAGTIAVAGTNAMGSATGNTLTINGGTIRSNGTSTRNLSGKYSGGITIGGDFTLGDTTNNGALTFDNAMNLGSASRTIQVNSAVTFGGVISGAAGVGITRNGNGNLTLSGNNSFDGGLNFNGAAVLALQHSNSAGTGTITLASTRATGDTAATLTIANGINVANDIIIDSATGRNTINSITSGNGTLSGNITINNNGSANILTFNNQVANSTYTIGAATPNSKSLTAASFAGSISFRSNNNTTSVGVINSRINAPNATFNLNNDGVWTVNSDSNSWAATILSTTNSLLRLGANNALSITARVDMGNVGADLDLNGFNQTVAGLVGNSTGAEVSNGSTTADSTLTLAGLAANRSFNGAITDGSGGRKTSLTVNNGNAFTQTLSGTSTYTGDTLVSAGTLLVNGSLGNTAVSVTGTATVGGTGTLGGSLDLAATAFFNVANINNPLAVTGTVTFGSGFGINNLTGINWDSLDLGTPFTLISTAQTFGPSDIAHFGFDNRVSVGSLGREAYFTDGSLAIVIIPEPGAALLGGIGVLTLLRRRRS